MPSKIKVIIFDLGGVYFADGTTKAVMRFKEMLHVPKSKLEKIFGDTVWGATIGKERLVRKNFGKPQKESYIQMIEL